MQIKCKSSIKGFLRTYPFIAAVTPYCSIEWEKLNTFYMLLIHKLPVLKGEDYNAELLNCVDLDQVQVVKIGEHQIELENKDTEIDPIPVGTGKPGKPEPDLVKLSDILEQFNEINWTNRELVMQQLNELPERLSSDATFINAARNSNENTARMQCFSSLMTIVAGMLNENTEFCREYMNNPRFMDFINDRVFSTVYDRIRNNNQ